MDTDMTLQVTHLGCIRQQKILFANLSFNLQAGAALLIEGPNGSGKSSLLKILAGLSTPEKGNVFWNKQDISNRSQHYWSHLHYVGHTNGIRHALTVVENLQLMSHLNAMTLPAYDDVLAQLQLLNYQHTQACHLSAGQKRKLALAKLFLFPKKIWILDEPLTALDAASQELFLQQCEQHILNGGMCIISSHHPLTFTSTASQTLRLTSC